MSDLALLNGMLHAAKQAFVPEATPVPGCERRTLHQMTSQDIASGKKSQIFFRQHLQISRYQNFRSRKRKK